MIAALQILQDNFQHSLSFLLIFIGILSAIIGSFLNVVIARLPTKILHSLDTASIPHHFTSVTDKTNFAGNLLLPRSHCLHCLHPIRIFDNIPILSFIVLKGKCRDCKQPIAWRYPAVELSTVLLSIWVTWHFGWTIMLFPALILTWNLCVLAWIDLEHFILPDEITLSCLWLGLLINSFSILQTPQSAIFGAILGYGILWTLYWIFKLLTKKEGLGYGDFKLLSMLGAWLGWQSLIPILLIASLLGSLVGVLLIFSKRRKRSDPLPFGPFLSIAGFVVLLYGNSLLNLYLGF